MACFCTGACMRNGGFCPNSNYHGPRPYGTGDFPEVGDPPPTPWRSRPMPCIHPQHNPPGHLFIPPGCSFTHVCPGCGASYTLTNPIVTC